ncbi:hypothetical protein HRM2_16130 [Desulforapulum autotrophicum HRM2]|uniref:Uncharacterized protein n=1 Tax=Desulforapulum autotrophicum (strain ATCC 43914 / DSM 3382 / VKM B-1955 / HRM2) TaxID=177437 RepID=C0QAD7_DESAH|nr:hypothetical protein [Desulforapulum autotrophicum]ACN14722.1 hypothetical protein HRM2_16130 [Desulforapulum autotrophicum HRM2]
MDSIEEKFPRTVAAAIEILIDKLTATPREKVKFANMSKSALVAYNKTIENYIVTEFRLPGNEPLMKSCALLANLSRIDIHQASYILLHAMQIKLLETAFLKLMR